MKHLLKSLCLPILARGGLLLLAAGAVCAAAPAELPPLRLVPKPADSAVERRPRPQPTVPDGAKEIPFVETAPEPAFTESEKERGYLLFQRPLTESVYPNTRPLAHERLEALVTFAAALTGGGEALHAEARQDLADPHRMALRLPALEPGAYTLRLTIRDTEGKKCSELAHPVTAHSGPLY